MCPCYFFQPTLTIIDLPAGDVSNHNCIKTSALLTVLEARGCNAASVRGNRRGHHILSAGTRGGTQLQVLIYALDCFKDPEVCQEEGLSEIN